MTQQMRYTVVIPSRNRQTYCVEAVQSVLHCGRDDVQIIVVDNSEDTELLGTLLEEASLRDRVDYLPATGEMLPMNENWERALEHVRGDWLLYIGDDDGMMPSAFETLDYFTQRVPIQAYRWATANYKWPCFPSNNRGLLNYPNEPMMVLIRDAQVELQSNARWAMASPSHWPSLGPSVYHGAVNMTVINAVKERFGRYFYNNFTDYASGVLNMSQLDSYLYFNTPLTIMGASCSSNTAIFTGEKYKELDRQKEYSDIYASDDYKDFRGSCLAVPCVIARFRELFELLNIPFQITPKQQLLSCLVEFSKLRNQEQFENERQILIRYAKENQLNHVIPQIEQLKVKESKYYIGNVDQEKAVYVDTIKLGIKGVADLARNMDAFCMSAENLEKYYAISCQQLQAQTSQPKESALA